MPDLTDAAAHDGRPTPEHLRDLLRAVIDPELGSDIVDLGMVPAVAIDPDGSVAVTVALTTAGCPLRAQIQRDVRTRLAAVEGVTDVRIEWTEMTPDQKRAALDTARRKASERPEDTAIGPNTQVVLIASGKGGVGKSSVTVNLAAALAERGLKVGVLDADIWGFSVPRMLGVSGRLAGTERDGRKLMLPNERIIGDGVVRVVSMGFLVEDESSALMWRGLMLNRGVQHFLQDVAWGDDLDYLLVDMPPGTGDVQMGVARLVPRAEVIVVTTPAVAAQKVAGRVVDMARKNFLRVAGVIENMSDFTCEHGETYPLFGSGGGATLAHDAGAPLLGSIPLESTVAAGGDAGEPSALGDGPAAQAFRSIAAQLHDEIVPPRQMAGCSARLPAADATTAVAAPVRISR
ncbi:MAG TPA: Mrp/NBP35 family ATP-binding protein [Acidimicrobiales bacterium]|jgi:ATP-binding protein involved in chromosome partitioning|nr:Mrp/NBP35 family ATP-binding protein [Acidimicrobiales bacterium]